MEKKMEFGVVGGRVYQNGHFIQANVYGSGGKITQITTERLECETETDARGAMVLPGFIDPHVHFHLGVKNNLNMDDFVSGSKKAALGGITTYIDFLDPVKSPDELEAAFEARMELAKESVTDYAFHATVANPSGLPKDLMEACEKVGITSVKLFTTYADTDRRTYDCYIRGLLEASKENGMKVVIHAENDDLIWKGKEIPVKDHERSRDSLSERTEIVKLAEMAKSTKGHLYIVHVSAGSSVKLLSEQYHNELMDGTITVESCPHYFIFNSEIYQEKKGYLYTMTPPLRPETDRELLLQYFDQVHTIGTDHCPYPAEKKNQPFTSQIPMGIGGIEYSFLNMYTIFGDAAIDKYTVNPAKAYDLDSDKGIIAPGASADLVLFDDSAFTFVEDESSLYYGHTLKGAIRQVFLRGNCIVKDGQLTDSKGSYLPRHTKQKG